MVSKVIGLFLLGMLDASADSDEGTMLVKAMAKAFVPAAPMTRPGVTGGARLPVDTAHSNVQSSATGSMQSAVSKALANLEEQNQEMEVAYQHLRASIQKMPQASDQTSFGWLAGFVASVGLAASVVVAAVRKYSGHGQHGSESTSGPVTYNAGMQGVLRGPARTAAISMYNIDHHDDIWGLPAKTEVFQAFNPALPRDYNNFNPFERNDDGSPCDKNGCFPGQDSAYMPPNRPDVSWDIQQANNAKMELLKADPKFSSRGQPGNWKRGWSKNLGSPNAQQYSGGDEATR